MVVWRPFECKIGEIKKSKFVKEGAEVGGHIVPLLVKGDSARDGLNWADAFSI